MNFIFEAYLESLKSSSIPIGAVLVKDDAVILRSYNTSKINPFLHAEAKLISKAYDLNIDLTQCIVFVTMEPCLFCASLLSLSRCKKVIFGVPNIKFGSMVSKNCICNQKGVYSNLSFEIDDSYNDQISSNLREFFLKKRSV